MSENYKPDTASATGLAVRMKSLILPVLLLLVGTMTDDTQPLFSEAAEALVNVPVYIEPSYDSSKHEDNASRQVNVDTGDLDTPTKADWSNSAGSSKKYYFSWFFSGISTFTSFLTGTRTETKAAPNDHSDQRNKCKGPSCWPFRGPKVVQSSTSSSPNPQDLPTEFDARKKYETQCPKISSIKNQYNCGACWAIAVASAFSDRLCIHSRGKITYEMSSAQLLSCSNPGDGCDGGEEEEAWKYIIQNGVVTGGGYGSNEGCQPYPFGPTEKRWWHNIHQSDERTPECSTALCPITHKAENFQRFTNEYAIQREILVNGPVTASMRLYQSYYRYEKGIYHKTGIFDLPRGLHAVRIVGWGEENGIKYWRVANSKGSDWGEDGTFRIVRGINNCGIEENVLSAIPVRNGW